MVSMYAALRRSGGIEAVARRLSVPTPVADQAVTELLPLVLGALRRRIGDADDAAAVLAIEDMFEAFGGSRLAAEVIGGGDLAAGAGEALSVSVFGSRETLAAVRAHVGRGAAGPVNGAALPLLTMLVGGYVSARIGGVEVIDADLAAEIVQLLNLGATVNPLDAIAP